MTDPDRRATMDVLTMLTSPALFTEENLFRLVVCRMAALSLEHGHSDGSCLAYAWLGSGLGMSFGLTSDCMIGQLRLIRMLRGLRPTFTSLDGTQFDEGSFEQRLESKPQLAIAASWYWIRKLQACVYAGDYASAVAAASKAESVLWTTPTQFELPEYHFYAALARAADCEIPPAEGRPQHPEP